MILNSVAHDVTKYGASTVVRATIKATAKVFDFFANTVYANKFEAICRELVANGVDAHVAVGTPDRPVEVTLPTLFNQVYKVRDYGVGMSHEFMTTNFMAYSDGSTKDSRNDQIGGFGVGSKSPFAYVDQFTVRSVHDGVLGTYAVFRDEDGCPSLMTLSQESTDEPNGVEVSFAVVEKDIERFHVAAHTALVYFDPLPVLHGSVETLQPPVYVTRCTAWGMRRDPGNLKIVMGGVAYPVSPTFEVKSAIGYGSTSSDLLGYGIDIYAPIGSCSVALSREALSLDAPTLTRLAALVNGALDEIKASMATIFEHHPTRWDAAADLAEQTDNQHGARSSLLKKAALYRGELLTPTIEFNLPEWEQRYIPNNDTQGYRRRRHSHDAPPVTGTKFEAATGLARPNHDVVLIDDLPLSPTSRVTARIETWVEDNGRSQAIRVFRPRLIDTPLRGLLDALGNPPVTLLSTIDPPAIVRQARVAGDKRVRPRVVMHELRQGDLSGDTSQRHFTEIPHGLQEDTGIYVPMTNYRADFSRIADIFHTELVDHRGVVWINKGDADKLNPKAWRKLDDVYAERLATKLKDDPELPQRLAVRDDRILAQLASLTRSLTIRPSKAKTPIGQAVKWASYGALNSNDWRFRKAITPTLPKNLDPAKLLESLKADQPLVWALINMGGNFHDVQAILEKVL